MLRVSVTAYSRLNYRSAAKATGCKVKITMDEVTFEERNNAPMAVSSRP